MVFYLWGYHYLQRLSVFFPLYPERTLDELTVDIRAEDRPHSEIFATNTTGKRLPLTTPLQKLSLVPFVITIDGAQYLIDPTKPEKPALDNLIGTSDVTELAVKSYFREVKRKLKASNRTFVSLDNYNQLCKETGLTEVQAQDLLRAMHFSGDVLHFGDAPDLKKYVFLFPDHVSDTLVSELGILFTIRDVPQLVGELQVILPEYVPLNQRKIILDTRAQKSAQLWMAAGLGYLLAQFGILARMVWWDFNWDIMEPISYFVSLSTLMLGYIFFVLYREEYTYDALLDRQRKQALRKLYINDEFNWKRWNELHIKVESLVDLIGPHNLPSNLKTALKQPL